MAMNPMQKKANMYLIIGVVVTLLITGSIIAFLAVQLVNMKKAEEEEAASLKKIYILAQDVVSGDVITSDMLKQADVPSSIIPANAITLDDIINNNIDEEGNLIEGSISTVAKININSGTILTSDMVQNTDDTIQADQRIQEYNMIQLPTQLQNGEYIDIRLRLPSGEDYIVVSKKKVELPIISGVDSLNSIWIKMSEADILAMSNAIVEAYIMKGSVLYATRYAEAGMQTAATSTYVPSQAVMNLMYADPNIVQNAKNELLARYQSTVGNRNSINNSLNIYAEDSTSNIEEGVQEEINKALEERQQYLESLGAE